MNAGWLRMMRMSLVSALGLTILVGTPLLAQADQGKWWTPKWGNGHRVEERGYGKRGHEYRGNGRWARGSWRGVRPRRDIIVIRDTRRGGYFRARRVFYEPRYVRRVVYVRPVRYFISADALIGGIGIHARIHQPRYVYGCNFCDAQFETYDAYSSHVEHACVHRPSGYNIHAEVWDGEDDWNGPYETDDGGWYPNDDRYEDEEWDE